MKDDPSPGRLEAEPGERLRIFGPQSPGRQIALQAGPVAMHFDAEWGFLRDFEVGGREVLRAIYGAVRTERWATVRPRLANLVVESKPNAFHLTFDAECVDPKAEVDFFWRGDIRGEPGGSVEYALVGEARCPMRTNRTGLCVLHPAQVAGQAVSVEHVDGSVTRDRFPEFVSPHQPFFDIRAITSEAGPGVLARVTMEGETFEMEDQRNWSDASFKTYGTPLAIPLPHRFEAGHRVTQSVRFELLGKAPEFQVPAIEPVTLELPAGPGVPVPSVGTAWAPDAGPLDEQEWEKLRRLKPGHLMGAFDLTSDGWRHPLDEWLDAVERLGSRPLLCLTISPNHQPALFELIADLASWGDRLFAVLVRSATEPSPDGVTLDLVRRAFDRIVKDVPIAAAPGSTFAELNRHRPPAEWSVAMPLCPQVHAFDFESIIENIEAQRSMVESVRQFNSHPVFVGPISLHRHRQPDLRQKTQFTAAWTVASLSQLAPCGLAASLTYHEHAGKNGLLESPTEGVLAAFAGARDVAAVRSNQPSRVAALAIGNGSSTRLLIANRHWEPVVVTAANWPHPIELGPFGVESLAL